MRSLLSCTLCKAFRLCKVIVCWCRQPLLAAQELQGLLVALSLLCCNHFSSQKATCTA